MKTILKPVYVCTIIHGGLLVPIFNIPLMMMYSHTVSNIFINVLYWNKRWTPAYAQVGNPIHAYNLIRRFSIDIGNIERDIQEDDWAGDEKMMIKYTKFKTSQELRMLSRSVSDRKSLSWF